MTDDLPKPIGRDDQPTDAHDDAVGGLPADESDIRRTGGDTDQADSELLPPAVDVDEHERVDVDEAAKPGIDDYTN